MSTTTSDLDNPANTTAYSTGGSGLGDNPTDPKSTSIGAIVGAICGAILLVCISILATVLMARRQRRRRAAPQSDAATIGHSGPSDDDPLEPMPEEAQQRLRLSTIAEQPSPQSPTRASPRLARYKSARRSYGPDWPLGSADPLESHPPPVVDLEKRLSVIPRGGGTVPQLQLPTLPVTRLSPPTPGRPASTFNRRRRRRRGPRTRPRRSRRCCSRRG